MQVNKIKLSKAATDRLKQLKGRTGLTPNLLCRIGFCLSLNEPAIPVAASYDHEGAEFNRYTLLGEYDALFVAMLRQRLLQDDLSPGDMAEQFRAHLNRGVMTVNAHVKSLADIPRLSAVSLSQTIVG